ncbi:hypothetical protein [Ascidiaceihabitans sp.]
MQEFTVLVDNAVLQANELYVVSFRRMSGFVICNAITDFGM